MNYFYLKRPVFTFRSFWITTKTIRHIVKFPVCMKIISQTLEIYIFIKLPKCSHATIYFSMLNSVAVYHWIQHGRRRAK